MKEIDRRTFFKEGLKQIGAIIGIGVAAKSLKDVKAQEDSLVETDAVLNNNAEVSIQTYWDHEMRLRRLEGTFIPPQKVEGIRKV